MRFFRWALIALGALLVLRFSFFTVDAGEYAYVTLLGRHDVTLDGADGAEAGLHFGWPWPFRSVQRIDRRLQHFDLKPIEVLTPDPDGKSVDKNLSIEACVFWRVADKEAVDRFIRRLGSVEQARGILGERVTGKLGAAVSKMHLDDLIGTLPSADPDRTRVDAKVEALRQTLLTSLKTSFHEQYGIELVDIRLKRYTYPGAARNAIFDRIRSEREKTRKKYEDEGTYEAAKIKTDADVEVQKIRSDARFEEQRIRAEAEAEAMAIRNRAHAKDPEFYEFLKKMEQYNVMLGEGKGMLLLSTHRPMFDLMFGAPLYKSKMKRAPKEEVK